jgi:hypothetical protein
LRLRDAALLPLLRLWRREGANPRLLGQIKAQVGKNDTLNKVLKKWAAPHNPTKAELRYRQQAEKIKQEREEQTASRKAWLTQSRDQLRSELSRSEFDPSQQLGKQDSLLVFALKLLHQTGHPLIRAEWHALEGVIGELAARRARDAFVVRWRKHPVKLRAEGRNVQTNGDSIAVSGFAIELAEAPDLVARLSLEEADQAMRLAILTDLPKELPIGSLARSHPGALAALLSRELDHDVTAQRLDLLGSLAVARNAALADLVASQLWRSISASAGHPFRIEQAMVLALENAPSKDGSALSRYALQKPSTAAGTEEASFWWAVAFRNDAASALRRLETDLTATDPVGRIGVIECALLGLTHGREELALGFHSEDDRLPTLAGLTRLAFTTTPPQTYPSRWDALDEEDEENDESGGGRIVRPMRSTEIAGVRDALLKALAEIPGTATVVALREFAEVCTEDSVKQTFERAAHQRAMENVQPAWDERDAHKIEQEVDLIPRSGDELFALVERRLRQLSEDVTESDFSDGPLLALLDRPPGSDEATWAREREKVVQSWVAKNLKDRAQGRYAIVREAEVADQKEPDILVIGQGSTAAQVVVEVKIADNWSVKALVEALLRQLADQYLRPVARRHGILHLMRLDPGRTWKHPDTGRSLSFDGLLTYLDDVGKSKLRNSTGAISLALASVDAATFVTTARRLRERAGAPPRSTSGSTQGRVKRRPRD